MAGKVIRVCDECGSDVDIEKYLLGAGAVRLTRELCPPCTETPYRTLLENAEREGRASRRRAPMVVTHLDGTGAPQSTQKRAVGPQNQPPAKRTAKRPPRV